MKGWLARQFWIAPVLVLCAWVAVFFGNQNLPPWYYLTIGTMHGISLTVTLVAWRNLRARQEYAETRRRIDIEIARRNAPDSR